jgi:deoxycytidylate deaminase
MDDILDNLLNISKDSCIKQKLAAVIIKCKNTLSKPCCNIPKLSNKHISEYNITLTSIHAEENAILNYYGNQFFYNKNNKKVFIPLNKKNNINLFVARFDKNGNMCNARPCYNCLLLMKITGIKKVYYTTEDGIICENIKDMISILITHIANKNYINYNNLLKKQFTQIINKNNFNLFYKYNLSKILPHYKYKINSINNKEYIYIYDNNNILVIKTIIV